MHGLKPVTSAHFFKRSLSTNSLEQHSPSSRALGTLARHPQPTSPLFPHDNDFCTIIAEPCPSPSPPLRTNHRGFSHDPSTLPRRLATKHSSRPSDLSAVSI